MKGLMFYLHAGEGQLLGFELRTLARLVGRPRPPPLERNRLRFQVGWDSS